MHLFQVGLGSGGMVVLDLLARDERITRVTLVDPDVYQNHNVVRHLFGRSGVGQLKVDLAREWLTARRTGLAIETMAVDLTAPAEQARLTAAVASCDIGVCAADNEPAKFHFDQLFRQAGKPWTLGEVLSGGIGGWVHRFTPGGACYGCVASHLQRTVPEGPTEPAPDYTAPGGPVATTIPASRASIDAIAAVHALVTRELLDGPPAAEDFTSLLWALQRVPEVFEEPYRSYRFRIARSPACLICSVERPTGEDLDVALDQALARLGHG